MPSAASGPSIMAHTERGNDSGHPSTLEPVDSHVISECWAGTSAGFDLYTTGDDRFVAFYDDERNMTIGQRGRGEEDWTFARLPQEREIGWDAHNAVTLAVDADGFLHVTGNMHAHPLVYFRTTEPRAVTSFDRVPQMVGTRENAVTYPQFLTGPDDELIFTYRDGHSGGGDWLYNVYRLDEREWERLLDEPLTEGGDRMNAYPHGPVVGPDGFYHLCWVWRDDPSAQTNHDLCYARSADLRTWETSRGERLDLPLRLHTGDLVDPVPPYGGMINGNTKIGFDTRDRVIVSYHKFDHEGNTQLYNARAEDDGWAIYRTSDWDYRWAFGGGGTIPFDIELGPVDIERDGRLSQTYKHVEYGSGKWILAEETLDPVEWISPWNRYPAQLEEVTSDDPRMQVNWVADRGTSTNETVYALRWEALEPNRDRARDEEPDPGTLRLYAFTHSTG